MNKLFAPFLPPWAETGLQPAFYDLESGTVLQQTSRMYDKVNQLIRLFNELSEETQTTVEEYIAKFVELKDFVDDYFDNLDVQEEINNKLDVMAEDGTLAEIIDEYLYDLASTRCQETLLSLSFGMVSGVPQDFLNYSNDGVNWKSVKIDGLTGRDPSFVYDKSRNCFYITVTPVADQTHSFKIYKTTDFVTFEEKSLLIGTYYAEDIMAGDLYLDEVNDKLIVNFSYKTGNTVTDCDGQTIPEYWLYRVDLTLDDDIANITPANTPQPLVLTGATSTCMIDSNIIYHNNLYYMNCKDDINKIVQVYQSADGYNYNLITSNILNTNDANDNTIYLEGGSFFKFNDALHITLDSYANLHTQIIGKCKSNDFIHFDFSSTNLERMRHQSVISIDNKELKILLYTLKNFGYNTNDKLGYFTKYSDNGKLLSDGFSGEITAVPGLKYVFLGNATITNVRNPFHCDKLECFFATASLKTVTITKIDDVTVNKKFYNSNSNNGKQFDISLSKVTNTFPSTDYINIKEFDDDYISSYFTPHESVQITGGYAIRQGNFVNLYLKIKFTQPLYGNIVILNHNTASSAFVPRHYDTILVSDKSSLRNIKVYPVSGNIIAYCDNTTTDTDYIINGTIVTY